jgi:hypothetical protein
MIASCSSGKPAVSDTLSGTGIAAGTIITTLIPGSLGSYTGTVNISQTVSSGTTIMATGPIGFVVNPTTGAAYPATGGVDITRALARQIGVDVIFNPIVSLNSTASQTLNVAQTTNSAGATILQSQGFLTLSQQPGISGNPPPLAAPTPPLAPQPNVLNMFFVTKCNPPPSQMGGQLYDFSWINNNGVGICGNTFFPTFPATPQTDTLLHGIFHNLAADHMTFGAGPYEPQSSTNPFPPGGYVPPAPATVGECDLGYPTCMANLMTTGSLRTQPTVACALATTSSGTTVPSSCAGKPSFNNGKADQLTTVAQEQTTLPVSQETTVQGTVMSGSMFPNLPASGFLNPIPSSTATVMDPATAPNVLNVSVNGAVGVPNETVLSVVMMLPPPLMFASNKVSNLYQSRPGLVQDVDFVADQDNAPGGAYYIGSLYNQCNTRSAQCLIVEFNLPGAGTTDGVTDQISFATKLTTPVTNAELCGVDVTFVFNDGSMWTSALACDGGAPTANSQNPDLMASVQPQIVDQGRFTTATTGKFGCTQYTSTGCPQSVLETGLRDGTIQEAGAQICHRLGIPYVCGAPQ